MSPGTLSLHAGALVLMPDDDPIALRDPGTFGAAIRRHDSDLRGVVWSVVRHREATDDVMQIAYEKAFRSIDRFDGRSSFKTWLHSICYRAAIDYVRSERRRRYDELDETLPSNSTADSTALDRMELEAALEDLSPEQRAVLMLTAGQGYSFDEAAQIINKPRGSVASTATRARRKLTRWERS